MGETYALSLLVVCPFAYYSTGRNSLLVGLFLLCLQCFGRINVAFLRVRLVYLRPRRGTTVQYLLAKRLLLSFVLVYRSVVYS